MRCMVDVTNTEIFEETWDNVIPKIGKCLNMIALGDAHPFRNYTQLETLTTPPFLKQSMSIYGDIIARDDIHDVTFTLGNTEAGAYMSFKGKRYGDYSKIDMICQHPEKNEKITLSCEDGECEFTELNDEP